MKSAESYRKLIRHESCPEVDGVIYKPGVYKTLMVRMHVEPTKRFGKCRRIPDSTGLYRKHIERCADTTSVATTDE
ncbi:hypothetical protein COE50_05985 [Bacillus anthracis]|nr:hypothetical protein COE50_05985 [Bacillus anthracis]